jgi:hypothetical protein
VKCPGPEVRARGPEGLAGRRRQTPRPNGPDLREPDSHQLPGRSTPLIPNGVLVSATGCPCADARTPHAGGWCGPLPLDHRRPGGACLRRLSTTRRPAAGSGALEKASQSTEVGEAFQRGERL